MTFFIELSLDIGVRFLARTLVAFTDLNEARNKEEAKGARRDLEAFLVGASFAAIGVIISLIKIFEAIVPRWFPNPTFANLASGPRKLFLVLHSFRRKVEPLPGAYCYFYCYPANIDMFINDVASPDEFGKTVRVENAPDVRVRNLRDSLSSFSRLIWPHQEQSLDLIDVGKSHNHRSPLLRSG